MTRITLRITIALFLLFAVHAVTAQDLASRITPPATAPVITGTASAERLRFTAPNTVVQMQLQIYAGSGQLLFDVTSKGNVFDWTLQDSGGEHLVPGSYLCVVTVKSLSGKLSQRIGSALVQEKQVELQRVDVTLLTAAQQQAVGPIEENGALTILKAGEAQATTVLAHDGTDGQMIRGRGALTFRIGDFFSGTDTEQMRLTEAGNLGIGTSEPKAKLDVAGTIRAERFLIAKPKLAGGDKTGTLAADSADSVQPLIAGTGTPNQIAKWTNTPDTLGDSGITETTDGNIGIGTTSPAATLDVQAPEARVNIQATTGASRAFQTFNNTGGQAYFGLDNSAGNGLFSSGGAPYSLSLVGAGTNPIKFGHTNAEVTILSGGNLGIGTPSPAYPIDFLGNGGGNGTGFQLENSGTVGGDDTQIIFKTHLSRIFSMGLDRSTGMFTLTPNSPTLGGTGSVAIDALNGNVGIGTTIPAAKLDVRGAITSNSGLGIGEVTSPSYLLDLRANGAGAGNGMQLENSGTASGDDTQIIFKTHLSRTFSMGLDRSTGMFMLTPNSTTLGGVGSVAIDAITGNVGIGTPAPTFKLQVIDPSNTGLRVQTNTAGGTVASFGGFGEFQIDAPGVVGGRFAVTESGNVGVGTNSPLFKFHVQTGDDQNLVVRPGSDFFNSLAGIAFQSINDANSVYKPLDLEGSQVTLNVGSAGNVGIGIASPAEKLSVAGMVQSTSGGFKFPDGSVQTTAAENNTYTTLHTASNDRPDLPNDQTDISILHLNLPTGLYLLTATIDIQNFNDGFRNFRCSFSGENYSHLSQIVGFQAMNMHTVENVSSGGVDVLCHVNFTNNGSNSLVKVNERRLTAVKIAGSVNVQ